MQEDLNDRRNPGLERLSLKQNVNSGRNIKDSSKEINLEARKMDREWQGFNFKQRGRKGKEKRS